MVAIVEEIAPARRSRHNLRHGRLPMRRTAIAAVLLAATGLGAERRAPEIESITARDMTADLTFLASDRLAGRLTATPQKALAAEWIASRFERLGLKPVGAGGTSYQRHTGYHMANDDAERINYPKMEKIGRMVYQASWDLANAANHPVFDRR